MTQAITAAEAYLAVKIGEEWKEFEEVKAIPELGESSDKIDATHLKSKMREYVKDIPDFSSDLEFTMNLIPTGGESSNLDLILSLEKNKAYEFKVCYPQAGKDWLVTGDWSWRTGAGAVSAIMEIVFTIIPRTGLTITDIAESYTLSYDMGQGAIALPEGATYANGAVVTVAPESFVTAPEGMTLLGYTTQPNGGGVSYDAGSEFKIYSDMTLHAVWGKTNGNVEE